MPNWENIEKLRDGLAADKDTKYRKFDMGEWIELLTPFEGELTVKKLRENGPACGAAACLAGETVIRLAPLNTKLCLSYYSPTTYIDSVPISRLAARILGLDRLESNYMFNGDWTAVYVSDITRKQAIKYLTLALETKDVYATLKSSRQWSYRPKTRHREE